MMLFRYIFNNSYNRARTT